MTYKFNYENATEKRQAQKEQGRNNIPKEDGQINHPEHLWRHEHLQVLQREALNGNVDKFCRDIEIRDEMIENYNAGLKVEENRRYWKITSTNGSGTSRSVSGFIVKAGDKKFQEGDMLKAAGWAAPARNFARGNVLDGRGVNEVRWTGIG